MKNYFMICLCFFLTKTIAQDNNTRAFWSKKVVSAIDLREKQNQSLFAVNHEITKVLLEAVKAQKLIPYSSDSLQNGNILSADTYINTLKMPTYFVEQDTSYMDEFEIESYKNQLAMAQNNYYTARDLYQLELSEELIFDQNHSLLERKITAITLFIPADHPENEHRIQLPLMTLDYQACEKLFQEVPYAFWFNQANDSGNLNFADALELRLFNAYLVKVSNPENEYLADKYDANPKDAILGSHSESMRLMEFEHNLWEE